MGGLTVSYLKYLKFRTKKTSFMAFSTEYGQAANSECTQTCDSAVFSADYCGGTARNSVYKVSSLSDFYPFLGKQAYIVTNIYC